MGENDESVDVDNLLEQAFQRVEDSDKNGKEGKSKHPMDDIIMNEAKKAGLGTPRSADQDDGVAEKRRSDNRRRHQSSSSSADADSDEDRSKSRRKKRSRSREKRSRSHDRKKRDSSRDRKKKKSRSPDDRRRSKKRSE